MTTTVWTDKDWRMLIILCYVLASIICAFLGWISAVIIFMMCANMAHRRFTQQYPYADEPRR